MTLQHPDIVYWVVLFFLWKYTSYFMQVSWPQVSWPLFHSYLWYLLTSGCYVQRGLLMWSSLVSRDRNVCFIPRPSPCDLDPKVSGSAHRNTAGRVSGDSKTLLKIPPKLRLIKIKFTLWEMSHPHLAADVLWSGILIAFQLAEMKGFWSLHIYDRQNK